MAYLNRSLKLQQKTRKITYRHAQVVQPADLMLQVRLLHVANGVPDTGQPVGDEGKDAHKQHEDGSSVFWIAVQLTGDSYQP